MNMQKKYSPLSRSQLGIYTECVQHPGEDVYDQPFLYKLGQGVDLQKLREAFLQALDAHPNMNCRIVTDDEGSPVQYIPTDDPLEVTIETVDDIESVKPSLWKPFHFDGSPLVIIRLLQAPDAKYMLFQSHHIAVDGTTWKILFDDVENAYQGRPVGSEELTAIDFAEQETALRQTERMEADRQWYQEHIVDTEVETALIPDLDGKETEWCRIELPLQTDPAEVSAFCKANGVKVSNFVCSAFALLMSRYTGDDQVLFSTIWHGRAEKELAQTAGMFVATVPLYYQLKADNTVADLLNQGREMGDGTREHALYTIGDAVSELGIRPQTMFVYQGYTLRDVVFGGERAAYERLFGHATYMPLSLQLFLGKEGYTLSVEYMTNRYSRQLIDQLVESFDRVLGQMMNLEKPLAEIDVTSPSQLQLLDVFNQTDVDYDNTQTIVSLFRRQVALTPDNTAVVYEDRRYSYREVDDLSERIAHYIVQGQGATDGAARAEPCSHELCRVATEEDRRSRTEGQESVVSVLIPRSEWMVIASLGVLKAGCAYQPLDPSYPKERLNFMMKDASANLLIADEQLRPIVDEYQGEVLFTKDIAALPAAAEPVRAEIKPSSLFIMLYTSGSTGVPKGCQLEHGNLVAYCHWYQRFYELSADCRVAAYASYGFDACMMDMYPALTCGACVYIISEDIRLNLPELNAYFEANGITHSFMTTQVGYQFATNVENHSLRYFTVGGEKLSSLNPPKGYKMYNAYGPTECTIFTTNYLLEKYENDIPIGKPLDNMRLYIVDRFGHRLPVGACGELWVSGPQVSRGYLNRPDKTAEVYIQNPFAEEGKYARVYRTGDIVRYLPDGNIQFVGRKDGQVKIRGFRIELKEVETIIRQFAGIKDVTVQAFDDPAGGKFIAAYVVSDEPVDIQQLNNFILDEKPPYMVPAVTMQIDRIPLNQNQKVDKKALPKPEKKADENQLAENVPMNVLEQELKGMIAAIVGHEDFGVTTPLGYTGLTSISSIRLAVQVNKRFGVALDSKSLVKTGTLQTIENLILEKLMSGEAGDGAAGKQQTQQGQASRREVETVPLSYAQMGVYVDCMKQPASTIYNIPTLLTFAPDIDTERLEASLKQLVKAHPALTVHFGNKDSEVVQVTDPDQQVDVIRSAMTQEQLNEYKHEFVKPFNLKQGPLYRFEIVTTPDAVCLLIDFHHLVADGGSLDLFLNQLCALMDGQEIEEEDLSFAEFVQQEKDAEGGAEHQAARDFFHSQLSECEGVTEIASDLRNPVDQGTLSEAVSALDFEAVETFCRQHNITPAHLTLAATFYALARFTNQDRLCITTISSGRSNLRISNTMGMFVNTLALSSLVGDKKVMDFISETSRNFDETLRHENYPFAQIAADYDLSSEIMFAYQRGVLASYACQGHELLMENLELDVPKFRVGFYIRDHEGQPSVCIEYDNGRYSHGLMQSLAQSVSNAVKAFIRQPEGDLLQVSLLNEEQTQLLDSFNCCDVPYDDTQTIVSLFRRQVALTPEKTAVVFENRRYSYREVDNLSERIAQYIVQGQGARSKGQEDVVSVLIPRSEWMVIASLGVLKAGCAYQPLDPSYPKERLNFMMKDASASLLIADEQLRPIVDEYEGEVLYTKDIAALPAAAEPVQAEIKPSSLFIMLYTSGSTGVPKGCQLEHGNLVAFCHWYQRFYELSADCRVAAYASYGFDACMMDMYPALTCGACVYIISEDIRLNLPELNTYFEANGITHSFMTTQVGFQFATNVENHSLHCFAVGGEKLSSLNPPEGYKMYNGYGPTECTIFTTNYLVEAYENDIPIGKPLDNMRLYIVDRFGHRLPLGACGELWVSGPQVSRGYLNRPEKTAEVYIQNPFAEEGKYARVYRTGDIVRYQPDGNIQFVGRRDGQVKIRGFRIELKEVEAVIRQFPGIKDATVQAFDYENGGKYIAAYVVSDSPIDIKELNDFIGQRKPSYMIPAATMQIDAIPLNQNQKVNRKALPKPVLQAVGSNYVAPANDLEKQFCDIFAGVLAMDKVGALDNFFELGGTSLMVTRVIIDADKHGHHIAYGDLFSHPTPRQLAHLLKGDSAGSKQEETATGSEANYDYKPIDVLLMRNTLDNFRKGDQRPIGNVLLTGSTGYLGIHVLKELIDRPDVPTIWCMVRAENEQKAERRLKQLLFYYFGRSYQELFGSRLRIALGDVTREINIEGEVNTVFNCAAVVKHFSRGTEIEDVNVGGAVNCVKFCVKTGARLIHVSTYSTAGLSVDGVPAKGTVQTEQNLYFGQQMDNQYIHSKFISERVVLESVALHGLDGKVMRVGNLAPRSTDGEFQINFQTNSAMGRIRVFKMLGCYPYEMSDEPMEFSPINEVAQAIVLLSQTPEQCTLFHPYNNHNVLFGDVVRELGHIGDTPKQVEASEFASVLDVAKEDPEKAKRLTGMLAYQDMAHGKEAFMVPTINSYTTQVLYRLGFHWSTTSWDYVDQFLTAIDGMGYFD